MKITCYLHVWRYEVFAGKLTWYFTGVYIINCFIICRDLELGSWLANNIVDDPYMSESFFFLGTFLLSVNKDCTDRTTFKLPRWVNFKSGVTFTLASKAPVTKQGVSDGLIQFKSAPKIWPLLELFSKNRWALACLCSQKDSRLDVLNSCTEKLGRTHVLCIFLETCSLVLLTFYCNRGT